jgi:hypothetical protein
MLRTSFLLEDSPPCQDLIDIELLLAFWNTILYIWKQPAGWH